MTAKGCGRIAKAFDEKMRQTFPKGASVSFLWCAEICTNQTQRDDQNGGLREETAAHTVKNL